MKIPDCYEGYRQADKRESDWDSYSESLPVCASSGYPITGHKLVYIQSHDEFYCLDCIYAMTECNEAAEVEE